MKAQAMHQMGELLEGPYKYLKVFISHATEDKLTAEAYARLLGEHFSVWHFERDMPPGASAANIPIDEQIEDAIRGSHFFIVLISDHTLSPERPYVSRELGLALQLQKERASRDGISARCVRPIIVPIFCRDMNWRRVSTRPQEFPVRDFASGELQQPYPIHLGHDPHDPKLVRSDAELCELMKPRVCLARREIKSADEFRETRVFELYRSLFPPIEQDDENDVIDWCLKQDNGARRKVVLPGRKPDRLFSLGRGGLQIKYCCDSRFYILSLFGTAIALCFISYEPDTKLAFGNYIAVGRGWRGGAVADKFRDHIERDFCKQRGGPSLPPHPGAKGVLFEVEPVDFTLLSDLHAGFKQTGERLALTPETPEYNHVRRLKRLWFYQRALGAQIILNTTNPNSPKPLVYTAPCLDVEVPEDQWTAHEEDYWLIFYSRRNSVKVSDRFWKDSVYFCAVTILAIGVLIQCADASLGRRYLRYANAVAERSARRANAGRTELGQLRLKRVWKDMEECVSNFSEIDV